MKSLSYSQIAQISSEELKELKEYEKKKELYSKEYVTQSINFAVSKENKKFTFLNIYEIFYCYLAIILARDKEIVAVWLKILQGRCEIYLSKNSDWLNKDIRYIDNITKYLKNISKNAPVISKDNERDFLEVVTINCSIKLKSRLKKLQDDIELYGDNKHIKSFSDFLSVRVVMVGNADNTNIITISGICKEYYKKVKKAKVESNIPSKFLRHIKKVAFYMDSAIENLDQIIEKKLESYTNSLPSDSSDGQYIYGYIKGFSSLPDNSFNLFS
ncbi:hypothetical protein GLOIN_2v1479216 [Rhizophagus irregularis DAOM 181602=DAOM 197198]|uniref:Uncharacterized protein n=1 Tax=Rhizophagus irregularis (strain DAOM 181602 / DAOM 197198 / MUCL 43194) TaxID=747089 RepID=A0A2P4PYD2_RHIID|nr:hypothetical protein GLOIN_2v1479216 [Rhizophagus irregularis DAOM 181602=DAOM 197198]POG70393.1 hypothetical protein GLOIN_2v1479216 [Rhizophagus irregularis DAOM 181602=DAOM 197198]|eukprot:XP_025177259.1 hypothetical protein GLOIN_2v1479216 [Rhizophagus irregularis DAOM 181602=DAOM 197198]